MFANSFQVNDHVKCGLVFTNQVDEGTTKNYPVPLQSVDINTAVIHCIAQVEITQVFANKEDQPIEAIYYFPVDPDGAVTHFEAEVEGRRIKALVKTNEEAREQYDKAMKQKKTAFLGEENSTDIFKIRVGYLKPGSVAKITIGYVTEVKNEKDSHVMRFCIPTTVAPRYIPAGTTTDKVLDLLNMKFALNSPAPLTIKTNISIPGGIDSVQSPTHKIVASDQGLVPGKEKWTKITVELSGTTADMDRDFVLLITPVKKHEPVLYHENFALKRGA